MITLTHAAIIARINRKLAPQHEALRKTRGARAVSNLGEFYILDLYRNCIIDHHCDPVGVARDLNLLKPYEEPAT